MQSGPSGEKGETTVAPEPGRFAYVWRYRIDPTRRSEFLASYGPAGTWAQLFSRDPAYLGTRLLRDTQDENRYVTIDYWTSRADRDSFRARFRKEFDDLDSFCEAFTHEEEFLGDFVEPEAAAGPILPATT